MPQSEVAMANTRPHWCATVLSVAALLVACRAAPDATTGVSPGMDAYAKDLIDSVAKLAGLITVAAVLLTFGLQLRRWRHDRALAVEEQGKATLQRNDELRWKRASAAKALNDEMLDDSQVATAFRVLDYPSAAIQVDGTDETAVVTAQQIREALNPHIPARTPLPRTLREAFDALFYYLATMEHYAESKLIVPEDVAYPLDYYYWHFERLKQPIQEYLTWYGLERANNFLMRQRSRLRGKQPPQAFTASSGHPIDQNTEG
jgi:hypothetical protein